MAVLNLQRRARELGRIRMGDRGERGQPRRLSNFRLTSADRALLEAAAQRYGGEVKPWAGQPGQFELYTTASELPCMVAPQEVSQWYELWSNGGCQRRCDGETVTLAGANNTVTTESCLCDPDNRECKLSTRLSVMLHELPGMGVWRLETHGFYAATELPASAELLVNLARRGQYATAALAIEERIVKRNGQTKKFPVPVIRIPVALATLMTGEVPRAIAAPAPALPESTSQQVAARALAANERGTYAGQTLSSGAGPTEDVEDLHLTPPTEAAGEAFHCQWNDCGKPMNKARATLSRQKYKALVCLECDAEAREHLQEHAA